MQGVNAKNQIFTWTGDGWRQIAGELKYVSASADGAVWGVNSKDGSLGGQIIPLRLSRTADSNSFRWETPRISGASMLRTGSLLGPGMVGDRSPES